MAEVEQRAYASAAIFFAHGPYAPLVEEVRAPAGAPLHLVRTRRIEPGDYPNPPIPELRLHVSLGQGAPSANADMGTGIHRSRFRPGTLSLSPANARCDYAVDGTFENLILNIPLADAVGLLQPAAPWFSGDFGRLHGPFFHDPVICSLAEGLWAEAAADTPLGRLFLDGAALAVLAALLRRANGAQHSGTAMPSRGGLPPHRLRRVTDLVGDRLAENLALADLAEAAGLSPFHFARVFRAETGVTPHRWLVEQRIRRAKELLATTELPIADVARACGFLSQAGLTAAFKRVAGTTPHAYRDRR